MNCQLLQFTQEVLSCRKCRTDNRTFVDGRTVLEPCWAPPRGWAGLEANRYDIAFVALNPGGPLDGEMDRYRDLALSEVNTSVSPTQAAGVEEYCMRQYRNPRRGPSWVFHRKSVALARALLWLIDGQDPGHSVLQRCWFTDVYKCSTRKESSPVITGAAFAACRTHLEKEITIVSPKLLVALGARAAKRLAMTDFGFVRFRHPSNGCPRLDAEYHDRSFQTAASIIGTRIPDDFRKSRRQVHNDALAM